MESIYKSVKLTMLLAVMTMADELDTMMGDANSTMYDLASRVVMPAMFGITLWFLYQAFMSDDKKGNWLKILGVLVFMAIFKIAPSIWFAITGDTSASGSLGAP